MYDGDKEALIKQCNNMRSGDEDELWDLVAQGINIDVRDEWGNTALIHAALNGSLEAVQELIRAQRAEKKMITPTKAATATPPSRVPQ